MALSIQDSRILLKRSTNTGETPTAAPSNDFTDGTWTNLDIYIGETFHNTIDEKIWLRFTNNIRQIAVADSPTTNRLTYWDASGHLGNVAAPTDGQYLKYTNASGYIWAAAGGGNETLAQTLALGNTSGAYDILMNTTQRIGFKDGDNTYTTYLSNNVSQAANRTVYLPVYDGQLAYHATGVPLTTNYVLKGTTNGAITSSSLIYDNGTNVGIGTTSLSALLHIKGTTSDNTAYALKVDNSSSSALLYVRNDGSVWANGKGATQTNTVFGYDAGISFTTGSSCVGIGYNALKLNADGVGNVAIGAESLEANTSGEANTAIGRRSLKTNTTGIYNTAIGLGSQQLNNGSYNTSVGMFSFQNNSTGGSNTIIGYSAMISATTDNCVAIGRSAGYLKTSGNNNVFVGNGSGYSNISGSDNVCIGYYSGYYETGSNKLFIDNQGRTNEATARTNSMIYGIFNSTPANQEIRLNAGLVLLAHLPTSSAGLPSGALWNNSGVINIV